MRMIFAVAAALLCSQAASAQTQDPDMSCADYLKVAVPTPTTGDAAMDKMAADIDGKVNAYCKANPKAKAMEAAMKAMGG